MKKFEQILAEYEQAEIDILKKVKEAFIDVKDIAPKFNATISTTYSKLNGNSVIMHHEKVILADMTRMDKKPLTDYEAYLTSFSKFMEENTIFRQDYFLKIIHKDNIGIKKRFKNPLLWKADEVKAILGALKTDLEQTPFWQVVVKS